MDSALETFIKGQQRRAPIRTEKTKKQEKALLKADKLVNDLIDRRRKIETRSAFLNQHEPSVAGSHPIPDPEDTDMLHRPIYSERQINERKPASVYHMVESDLPKIAPGLVPARLKAIEKAAPSHDKILHESVAAMMHKMDNLRAVRKREKPRSVHSEHESDTDHGGSTITRGTSVFNFAKDLGPHAITTPRGEFSGEASQFKGWRKRHFLHRAELIERGMNEPGAVHKTVAQSATRRINAHIREKKRLPEFPPGVGFPNYKYGGPMKHTAGGPSPFTPGGARGSAG
jgi:hypothetical protein